MTTPHFYINPTPPFLGYPPLSSNIFGKPSQVTQILEGPTTPFNKGGGEGGPTMNPYTFFLAKQETWKRTFNINIELLQNRTEKQIIPFNTTVNWLLNMWCYLVIAFFDWKISAFQWTVVRVYCILNSYTHSQGTADFRVLWTK